MTTMTPREERGLKIAQGGQVVEHKNCWRVRSATRNVYYLIRREGLEWRCTCRDFELRQECCKHIYAVKFVMSWRKSSDVDSGGGERKAAVRPTYSQDWPAYNAAQTREKWFFMKFLHALCATVPESQQGRGRPRLLLGDMVFACVYKIYSGLSSRRFTGDLEDACGKGLIRKVLHFNSVTGGLSDPELTDLLENLVLLSSLPLRDVESGFALDSSGFSTCRFVRWFNHKYGRETENREWVKAHVLCGVKTHIVAGVGISEWYTHDSRYLVPLVERVGRHFGMERFFADKAYLSHRNLEFVAKMGALPYIPFKSNTVAPPQDGSPWSDMYYSFMSNRRRFLAYYHQRSNVESVFSMMKAKFGDSVRSKRYEGQVNEVLCKVLCHNLCVLIHAMFELGIRLDFGTEQRRLEGVMGGRSS